MNWVLGTNDPPKLREAAEGTLQLRLDRDHAALGQRQVGLDVTLEKKFDDNIGHGSAGEFGAPQRLDALNSDKQRSRALSHRAPFRKWT